MTSTVFLISVKVWPTVFLIWMKIWHPCFWSVWKRPQYFCSSWKYDLHYFQSVWKYESVSCNTLNLPESMITQFFLPESLTPVQFFELRERMSCTVFWPACKYDLCTVCLTYVKVWPQKFWSPESMTSEAFFDQPESMTYSKFNPPEGMTSTAFFLPESMYPTVFFDMTESLTSALYLICLKVWIRQYFWYAWKHDRGSILIDLKVWPEIFSIYLKVWPWQNIWST